MVIGADSKESYLAKVNQTTKEPLRFFIAHTDHPGFHAIEWKGKNQLKIRWFGGSPIQKLIGAKVWLADANGYLCEGKIKQVKIHKLKYAMETGVVELPKNCPELRDVTQIFGGFAFRKPIWNQGKTWYTKAADDLVGAGVITYLSSQLKKEGSDSHFIGLLTRAEEVGLLGAASHLEMGWFKEGKRPRIWVSLETSRTLPGAHFGKGPVVRLGDRGSIFHTDSSEVMRQVAVEKLGKKFQRRVMDGGNCEATAVLVYGEKAIGISIPLGNYHNQSFEGGPDSRGKMGPAPEFVHRDDIAGMYQLCLGLMKEGLPWDYPWQKRKELFTKTLKEMETLF